MQNNTNNNPHVAYRTVNSANTRLVNNQIINNIIFMTISMWMVPWMEGNRSNFMNGLVFSVILGGVVFVLLKSESLVKYGLGLYVFQSILAFCTVPFTYFRLLIGAGLLFHLNGQMFIFLFGTAIIAVVVMRRVSKTTKLFKVNDKVIEQYDPIAEAEEARKRKQYDDMLWREEEAQKKRERDYYYYEQQKKN